MFTSDHGEELYERPVGIPGSEPCRGHTKAYLYEEAVRIPLLIRVPWRKGVRGHVSMPVSSLDVAPTILDLFDVPAPGEMEGRVLGRPPAGPLPERALVTEASPYGAVAMRKGKHKV